ncbi:MAG: flagellar biosynthetic protein FliR [Chromatiales bacterium]|nr:flagellar biosynthetic protein FliR [Gammaproteobacteria bacterium]MBW6476286.1 flagellar biosynthetic protein FliR [Chromatiales bacterium]
MTLSMAEITAWIGSFLWPFIRIGAMLMVAPVTSANYVPVRVRVIMAFAITLLVVPLLPEPPLATPFSWDGISIIMQQVLIGASMGFVLMMVFAAIVTGGQLIAMQMGLGFASMIDPQNGTQVPVLSQLFVIMTTLLFLVVDGHLILIAMVVESFRLLPIAATGLDRDSFWAMANWGTQMFAASLWLALPAVVSLLLVNISFGVMARAAPQLNIFAIGFPVAIVMGFVVIYYTLGNVAPQFNFVLMQGWDLIDLLLGGGS